MTLAAALAARIATAPTPEDRLALTPAIWRAHLAGGLTDDEAQHLATLAQPAPRRHDAPQRTPARKLPTQRSPDRARSIARRRTLATSGAVPYHLAAHFSCWRDCCPYNHGPRRPEARPL